MTATSGDFGPYKIVSEIGRGGMGVVYQAVDSRDGRTVAIKQLVLANIDPAKEQEFRDRFRREAATAARLTHPNIVTVFDIFVDSTENPFYAMEMLEGHSLRRELDRKGGRLTVNEWWPIFEQTTAGLTFAHNMNVVHRDVKPDNIFILKDGTVKITDFGIARTAEYEQTNLTKTGVMMGTLAYVSPEQLQDAKNVDHRADIFSLGVVAYEAFSGQIPFTADGIAQTIVKIVSQEETPLHILLPLLDVHVSAVVSKALRKRARERYRTVTDFAKEFETALEAADRNRSRQSSTEQDIPQIAVQIALAPSEPRSNQPRAKQDQSIDAAQKNADAEVSFAERFKLANQKAGHQPLGAIPNIVPNRQEAVTQQNISAAGSQFERPLRIFNTYGKEQNKLAEPVALCYRSGRLVVADTSSRKLHMFTYDGRWVADCTFLDLNDSKTRGGALTKPSGIAIDVRGRIYVCDSSDPYIRIFDSRGAFIKEICNIQGKDSGIQGIAIDSTGLLVISDMNNACLQVFQADLGLWMRKIGEKER